MTRAVLVALAVLLAACGSEAEPAGGEALDQQQEALVGSDCPATPAGGVVSLRTGVEMYYREQGSPEGDVVIFLHGYTDSHHSFDLNLPLLPARYHAFALDQRGHGLSSSPASGYEIADFVEDVVAFMDAKGIRKASLVGHSMGSFIAHGVAARHPDRVTHLVLIGSATTCLGNPVVEGLAEWVDTFVDPLNPDDVYGFQASTFFQPVPASYLDTMVQQSLRLPAERWKTVLHGLMSDDHSAALSSVRARTLVLFGDQDGLFTMADQQLLVAAIPRAKLVVLEQTGHGLHAEQPARFEAELERFLR